MNLSQKKLVQMLWTVNANELDPDEMAVDNEDGGDDTASTSKPLTANPKV